MDCVSIDVAIDQNISSIALLKVLSASQATGYLKIIDNSVIYHLYLNRGKLIFATNTVSPFERLNRCLRECHQTASNFNPLELSFNFQSKQSVKNFIPPDYQAMCWWLQHEHIDQNIFSKVIKNIILEVLESYVCTYQKSVCQFLTSQPDLLAIEVFELDILIEQVFKNLEIWKKFQPQILSPYQRPYIVNINHSTAKLTRSNYEKLFNRLNIRQIAAASKQSEIEILETIHPQIIKQNIRLEQPLFPFNQLQVFEYKQLHKMIKQWSNNQLSINEIIPQAKYKIVYVDCNCDNLDLFENSLDRNYAIYTVSNPAEALIEIIKYKPDLVFLTLLTEPIGGYELAQLIRKNPVLQQIPIIFVGQKTSVLAQVKAKLLGVQDYLIEPFTSADIQSIVQKYLN